MQRYPLHSPSISLPFSSTMTGCESGKVVTKLGDHELHNSCLWRVPAHRRKGMSLILVFEAKPQVKEWSKTEELHFNLICKMTLKLSTTPWKLWRHTYHEPTSFSLPPSIWYGASWVTNNIIEPSEMKNRACKTFSAMGILRISGDYKPPCSGVDWLTHTSKHSEGFARVPSNILDRMENQKVTIKIKIIRTISNQIDIN